jgi:hypothetical protein
MSSGRGVERVAAVSRPGPAAVERTWAVRRSWVARPDRWRPEAWQVSSRSAVRRVMRVMRVPRTAAVATVAARRVRMDRSFAEASASHPRRRSAATSPPAIAARIRQRTQRRSAPATSAISRAPPATRRTREVPGAIGSAAAEAPPAWVARPAERAAPAASRRGRVTSARAARSSAASAPRFRMAPARRSISRARFARGVARDMWIADACQVSTPLPAVARALAWLMVAATESVQPVKRARGVRPASRSSRASGSACRECWQRMTLRMPEICGGD